jgi:hypothetical protein
MTESLHAKLEKILRLANHEGTSEEERDAAMARAQEIAFKHNIDLLEIQTEDKDLNEVLPSNARWMDDWESELLFFCANVNFCRAAHYKTRNSKKQRPCFIYGKKHNIDATFDLFMFLHDQIIMLELVETGRRDKRLQYARKVLLEVVKDLISTAYMKRVLEEHPDATTTSPFNPDHNFIDAGHDALVEAAAMHLQGNDHMLKGNEGLIFIMDRTGLTASYASEIRPYLRRGEYAPEIVKNMGVWRRSFLIAIVNRVGNRLIEKFADLVDDAGDSGLALVRKEDAGLDDFDKDMDQGEETKKKYDPRGLVAGTRSAEKVNLEMREHLTNTEGKQLNA